MSLPKEPRQKMINMMYLVLTALLALNVSVEVLNAFKTVNRSIERSNEVVSDKNDIVYKAFTNELADGQTAALAKIWAPPAMKTKQLSSEVVTMLDSLKAELISESNPQVKDGRKEYTEGDLDAATRIFDERGKGKILYDKLKQYRLALLNIVDPSNFPDASAAIKADLAKQKEEFAHRLPLDTRIPRSEEESNAPSGDSAKDWTIAYFHMTPTVAALTILSKFQSDVKNSESQVIDYLHKQIGEVKIKYDKFSALVSTNSTYLMPGDELDVSAGIGAFSAAAQPDVYINGSKIPLGDGGMAEWKSRPSSSGDVNVRIEYAKPDGSKDVVNKVVKYTVGQPSGASVFLEKMNVLYIKEDNPVKISGGSVGREKVHVSFTNGEITNTGGDDYNVVPTTPGEGKIVVNADGKVTEFKMRVKYLPDPTAYVGTKKGGAISSAEFKAIGGVIAKLEGSEFQSSFRVVGFKVGGQGGPLGQYQEATNEGNRWTGSALNLVSKAGPGSIIYFDNVRAVGKDGKTRELPPMVFQLK